MKKINCFRCKGRGQITYEVINLFNFLRLERTENCTACHGEGWIYE